MKKFINLEIKAIYQLFLLLETINSYFLKNYRFIKANEFVKNVVFKKL